MDKAVEKAFDRFNRGERPWNLVERNWYVIDSFGFLYPLKYIWALATNSKPLSFSTYNACKELISRNYSVINRNIFLSERVSTKATKYPKIPLKKLALITIYDRNPVVIKKVLERAKGKCEKCNKKAPFIKEKDNTPYLEVHHIIQLANGGEDTIENATALCPNCHRHEHFGVK